ncbi:hypothetical protein KNP414_07809 [Paenibacillus mucilaginosus KNP414]|uniref:Uncharacterized protein n=1 Tax=Paenibacillus mucilaginosus (strain KNP414) TaxID=1036673 RepID=F8FGZ4_PAEMK|nr:hypothetical protein KNP414_07809 [Paenibacillus mucilaginosus KNP414]
MEPCRICFSPYREVQVRCLVLILPYGFREAGQEGQNPALSS